MSHFHHTGCGCASGMSRRFTELGALADKVAEQSNAQIDTEVAGDFADGR